jgi:hypothetical protein
MDAKHLGFFDFRSRADHHQKAHKEGHVSSRNESGCDLEAPVLILLRLFIQKSAAKVAVRFIYWPQCLRST